MNPHRFYQWAGTQLRPLMLSSTLIDDFGLKPLRAPHDEDFHDLVAECNERGATVITSNLDFSEWGDAFPESITVCSHTGSAPTWCLSGGAGWKKLSKTPTLGETLANSLKVRK